MNIKTAISIALAVFITACTSIQEYKVEGQVGSTVFEPIDLIRDIGFNQAELAQFQKPVPKRTLTPEYYKAAMDAGIAGQVIINFSVGLDGKIESIELPGSPHPLLAHALVIAVASFEQCCALANVASKTPPPPYPTSAARSNGQGNVDVIFYLNHRGNITNVIVPKVLSPDLTAMPVFSALSMKLEPQPNVSEQFFCWIRAPYQYKLV
jgi:hypothetical protein